MPKNKSLLILLLILMIAIPLLLAYKSVDLQKLFKNLPGPGKEIRINVPKSATPSANLKRPYICPSVADFCQKGKDVSFSGQYSGFGGNPATGSPILALFDGDLITTVSTLPRYNNEKIVTVTLDNRQLNLTANYFYRGQAPTKLKVKAGEQIAATGEVMTPYSVSLLVQFFKGTQASGEKVHLTSKNFGF